jgi:hypothetical protein
MTTQPSWSSIRIMHALLYGCMTTGRSPAGNYFHEAIDPGIDMAAPLVRMTVVGSAFYESPLVAWLMGPSLPLTVEQSPILPIRPARYREYT